MRNRGNGSERRSKLTLWRLQLRAASGGVYLGIRHGVGRSSDWHGGVSEVTMGGRHGAPVDPVGEGVGSRS